MWRYIKSTTIFMSINFLIIAITFFFILIDYLDAESMALKLQDSVGLEWIHRSYSNSASRYKICYMLWTVPIFELLWSCCVIKPLGCPECLQRPEITGARKCERGTIVMAFVLSALRKEATAPFLVGMICPWLCAQVMRSWTYPKLLGLRSTLEILLKQNYFLV